MPRLNSSILIKGYHAKNLFFSGVKVEVLHSGQVLEVFQALGPGIFALIHSFALQLNFYILANGSF